MVEYLSCSSVDLNVQVIHLLRTFKVKKKTFKTTYCWSVINIPFFFLNQCYILSEHFLSLLIERITRTSN